MFASLFGMRCASRWAETTKGRVRPRAILTDAGGGDEFHDDCRISGWVDQTLPVEDPELTKRKS